MWMTGPMVAMQVMGTMAAADPQHLAAALKPAAVPVLAPAAAITRHGFSPVCGMPETGQGGKPAGQQPGQVDMSRLFGRMI